MNYRDIKNKNYRATGYVLALFIFIFFSIGFLGEIAINFSNIPVNRAESLIDAGVYIFNEIINFKIIPYFIIGSIGVAFLIIFVMIKFGNKIMLAGSDYENLKEKEILNEKEQMLLNIIEELSLTARLRYVPAVYLLKENYMNAFASGWNENNAMVAITTELLDKLTRAEVEAVMAHEITHVRNADVKLTLVIGVLNNVMVYTVDILFRIFGGGKNRDSKAANQLRIILLVLKITLPILTYALTMYISRKREYLADAGAVEFTGDPDAMVSALEKISGKYKERDYDTENGTRNLAYIYKPGDSFFSTHPSIENRIKNLKGEK